jgi:hypothetical protein
MKRSRIGLAVSAIVMGGICVTALAPRIGAAQEDKDKDDQVARVLLISIDGMHAIDFENCVANGTCPHLAELKEHGVNYTRTSTSKPSDSFPGLMALVTGGTPKTVGAYYDVAYDRVLAPPAEDTGNGNFAGNCFPGVANGTTTEYEEGVDINQHQLNGGGPYTLLDGGVKSIKESRLPRDPFNGCQAVYPWNFIRANTIYGVIHAAGGYTAWSDKHAVYAAVSGPTGTKIPSNVDDYYSPDVNSDVIGLPGVRTAGPGAGLDCSKVIDPLASDWTTSFSEIQCYDQLKVNAVLNWINGKTHLGGSLGRVPNIFGMNFQAVSVGQKLITRKPGVDFGGYTDAAGTPTDDMLSEFRFVDAAIGKMVEALKDRGLFESTAIIITAKHGQSPIDPQRFKELGNGITTTPADVVASFLPCACPSALLPSGSPENPLNTLSKPEPVLLPPFFGSPLSAIGPTQDDISLLWLADSSLTSQAVNALESQATAAGIGQIFYGASLETMFNAPGVPKKFGGEGGDPRTPDIIVQPNVGVIFTGSSKKQAEHGGFAQDDTNVMLLVSNPNWKARTITSFVETTQVAPTILKLLGLDPNKLEAVQKEGTPVLPGLGF